DAATNAISNHESLVWAIVTPLAGLAFVVAGLFGWIVRPENGTGRLLVLVGGVFMVLATLWAANDSLLYTVGTAVGAVYLAIFVQLLLSYPTGRLRRRRDRAAVLSLYAIALLASLLPTFFDRDTGCSDCPPNDFLIRDSQRTADAINAVSSVIGIAIFVGLFVLLAVRWHRASAARR